MFKRDLNKNTIVRLRCDKLFTERLELDIQKRIVFPAIRRGRVDFYHKGGKIFCYQNGFSTHKKYASAIRYDSDYISESDLRQKVEVITNFFDGYEQIKQNCSLYSSVEAEGVSRIYHKYPFASSDSRVVVLDIEISFEAKSEERFQDRIDILLFNKKTQQLRFYEAKHYSNSELWAAEGTSPRVVSQIQRYEQQIQEEGKDILSEYCQYIRIVNDVFNCDLPKPGGLDKEVTLLVFGYDRDQQRGRMQRLLLDDGSLAGVQYYTIGNVSAVNIDNMWKAGKCG